MAVNYIYLEI